MRRRLLAIAPDLPDAVRCAGGWLCDQVMVGWDVTVLTTGPVDCRALRILGVRAADLEPALVSPVCAAPRPHALAVGADAWSAEIQVRRLVEDIARRGNPDLLFWTDQRTGFLGSDQDMVHHRPTAAARAFKTHALAALALPSMPVQTAETFRRDTALQRSPRA